MELTMPPRMLVQSPRGCCRIRGAYSEGRFQERKKLTMVKAQAYLKAGKTRKSKVLGDFLSLASPCSSIHCTTPIVMLPRACGACDGTWCRYCTSQTDSSRIGYRLGQDTHRRDIDRGNEATTRLA